MRGCHWWESVVFAERFGVFMLVVLCVRSGGVGYEVGGEQLLLLTILSA